MYFLLKRAAVIVEQLEGLCYSGQVEAGPVVCKPGRYQSYAMANAAPGAWQPFAPGDTWGGEGCHQWFHLEVNLPQGYNPETTVLLLSTGAKGWDEDNPQFLVYINDVLHCGMDINHRETPFPAGAFAQGLPCALDISAYSGFLGKRCAFSAQLAVLQRETRNLYHDLLAPLQLAQALHEGDKTWIELEKLLNEAVNLLDLREAYSPEYHQSVAACRDFLRQNLYDGTPRDVGAVATCIGHTHIDIAWLWTISQTREKAARSFSTVLRLMEEYPSYRFMSSQPILYQFIRQDHPQLYAQIKQRVREGRWEPEGAMWVEADCNLPCGESLVRQILYGKRFFREEFGVDSRVLWLPDVFGYPGALPQIMKQSGIDYFMTTKISWNQTNRMPCDTFRWQGIDGSSVLAHFITTPHRARAGFHTEYNGDTRPVSVLGAWETYRQKDVNNDVLISYGYGDGGGGPTRTMLEHADRLAYGLPGAPRVRQGFAGAYFDALNERVANNRFLPAWNGELYFELHRGSLTSMGRNKRDNRLCERMCHNAELLGVLAQGLGKPYPAREMEAVWQEVLSYQFHDILPGTAIEAVYEDTQAAYTRLLRQGQTLMDQSLNALTEGVNAPEDGVVVYNTLSFARGGLIELQAPNGEGLEVYTADGQRLDSQWASGRLCFWAPDVPCLGYAFYALRAKQKSAQAASAAPHSGFWANAQGFETPYYTGEWDAAGRITSLYHKTEGRQLVPEGGALNRLFAYEDKPMNWDNWDIDPYYSEKGWPVNQSPVFTLLETGPLRCVAQTEMVFHRSTIRQQITLYRNSPLIQFDSVVDWHEDQVLLKAEFDVDVHFDAATYDIQFGNVQRPAHNNTSWQAAQFEVCAHKWVDASEDGFGVSLLNDCKYGHRVKEGRMEISLIKCGRYPNPNADRERHRFTYCLYPHAGGWREAQTVQHAYGLNNPLIAIPKTAGGGALPPAYSLAQVDAPNVLIETVKPAEDGQGIILRLYESHGRRSRAALSTVYPRFTLQPCDLLENPAGDETQAGRQFEFTIRPYEIQTYRLTVTE